MRVGQRYGCDLMEDDGHITVSISAEMVTVARVLAHRINLIETAFYHMMECDDLWIDGNCGGATFGELRKLIDDKSYLDEIATFHDNTIPKRGMIWITILIISG